MKKNSIARLQQIKKRGKLTVGLDLGDRSSRYCIVDKDGEVIEAKSVATTKKDLNRMFGGDAA